MTEAPSTQVRKDSTPPSLAVSSSFAMDPHSRRKIVLAFCITVLLSVPFWHYSTALERRNLPTHEIKQWTQAKPCVLHTTANINLSPAVLDGAALERVQTRLSARGKMNCVDVKFDATANGAALPSNLAGADEDEVYRVAANLLDLETIEQNPRVAKFVPRYKLVFSLLNQNSNEGGATYSWEIDRLIHTHIRPLLESVAPLHNFTIESEIQYFAPLSIPLHSSDKENLIEEEDLRAFINTAAWNLPTSVSLDPVLHFILFVPSEKNRPMRIKTSNDAASTLAFLTPQRGGVVIFNPPMENYTSTYSTENSFQLFEQQLRKLLGVTSPPPTFSTGTSGPLESWQVDALVRRRLAESALETVDTLGVIVKLVESISNMRINKQIQQRVGASLRHLEQARAASLSSPSLALRHTSLASSLASKAYYDPSMLGLLYFPDEHKYAIYTPLFFPVAVPLLSALIKEYREWQKKRKARKAKQAEKDKVG